MGYAYPYTFILHNCPKHIEYEKPTTKSMAWLTEVLNDMNYPIAKIHPVSNCTGLTGTALIIFNNHPRDLYFADYLEQELCRAGRGSNHWEMEGNTERLYGWLATSNDVLYNMGSEQEVRIHWVEKNATSAEFALAISLVEAMAEGGAVEVIRGGLNARSPGAKST